MKSDKNKKEKKNKKITDNNIELCEGIVLSADFIEQKENRIYTLLLKGFIVYLLSMGAIGFYLSTIDANYNVLLCHIVIFAFAMLCAFLYYRLFTENLGYFILLLSFGSLVYLFRTYINSGFYAVVNMSVDLASQYLDVDIQRLYYEQIDDRYLTITMAAVFIGIVMDILLNVYISRRMQYATAMYIVMFLNVIPLYMVLEPDTLYALMVLAGISMSYVIKVSRHYSPQVAIKRDDNKFETRGIGKKEIFYKHDIKAVGQAAAYVAVFAAIVTTIVSTVKPKDSFNVGYEQNKYKELTMTVMGAILLDGGESFFRAGDYTGGLNSGTLGAIGSVRVDNQTDLIVRMTPYTYDTIYLKHFTGETYNPYQNNWTSINYYIDEENQWQTPEADAYAKAYDEGVLQTAKAVLSLRNIDGDYYGGYIPYYTKEVSNYNKLGFVDMVFYPRLTGSEVVVSPENYADGGYTEHDLYVAPENVAAIEEFLTNIDVSGTKGEIIRNVIDYYQDNIPYTTRPGRTPRKKDFVNYFLTENQKGYCAHYASAAVLIFRYLGIPARYIEGYAISYNQLADAELAEGFEYKDYYDGYSVLGETAVLQINVTDADAHAWVEVYSETSGWIVVDVTPYGDEEEQEDFWSMFNNIMGNGDNDDDDEVSDDAGGFQVSDNLINGVVYVILGAFAAALLIWLIIRLVIYVAFWIRFNKAGINDKLIIRYSSYYKKKSRHDKEFREKINYREQIEYIYEDLSERAIASGSGKKADRLNAALNAFDKDRIIDILEQAGFSDKPISKEDYDYVYQQLF